MLNKAIKLVEDVDIFGLPIQFSFKNDFEYKSIIGSILTTFVYVFTVIVILSFGLELFYKESPSTIQNELQKAYPEAFKINGYSFPLVVGIEDYDTWLPIKDERIFTVTFQKLERKLVKNETTGEDTYENIYTNIETEPCDTSKHAKNPDQTEAFKLVELEKYYCIKYDALKEPLKFEGFYDQNYYQQIYIDFNTCQNTTESQNCAPQEEIDTILKRVLYNVYHTEITIDASNYEKPFAYHQTNKYGIGSTQYQKTLLMDFKHVYVQSDVGIIFESLESTQSLKFLQSKELTDNNPNSNFVHIEIALEKKADQFIRVYKKVQDVLAEVGGLQSIIIAIIYMSLLPILRINFYKAIFNEIFVFENKKNAKKTQNNIMTTNNILKIQDEIESPTLSITNNNKQLYKIASEQTKDQQQYEQLNPKDSNSEQQSQIQLKSQIGTATERVTDRNQPLDNAIDQLQQQQQNNNNKDNNEMNQNVKSEYQNEIILLKKQSEEVIRIQPQTTEGQNSDKKPNIQSTVILEKLKEQKQLVEKIKKDFQIEKGGFKLTPQDYLSLYVPFGFKKRKNNLDQVLNKIINRFDSIYLHNKLIELDKLKKLLLNEDQLKLFNIISKPQVTLNSENNIIEDENEISNQIFENDDQDDQENINNKKGQISYNALQKVYSSFESYKNIKNKSQLTELDYKLLKTLDLKVKNLFEEISIKEEYIVNNQASECMQDNQQQINKNQEKQTLQNQIEPDKIFINSKNEYEQQNL